MKHSVFSLSISRSLGAAMLLCALLATGCDPKRIEVPADPGPTAMDDGTVLNTFRQSIQDDGIPLTDTELRALMSEGLLDKGLSAEEMKEVRIYFKYYLHSARPLMQRFYQRSQPYMEYTRQVFRERGMPEDLAMLAYLESGYNPMAVSRSNAVGMWQFMAPTGRQYGLEQSWWLDERRDPYIATRAAADYLNKLYGDFGDWHLAVAAYNAGEGKIGRALGSTQTSNFFALCRNNGKLGEKDRLKDETMEYVPRYIAICKVMRNAKALGLDPSPNPDVCLVTEKAARLDARPGTDLTALAQGVGMSVAEIEAYNPSLLRRMTPPDRQTPVYVPARLEHQAKTLLSGNTLVGSGMTTYTVNKSDSISKISARTGVPVQVLRQLNPRVEPLKAGTRLQIPGTATVLAAKPAPTVTSAKPSSAVASAKPASGKPVPAAAAGKPIPALASAQPSSQPTSAVAAALASSSSKPAALASAGFSAKHTVKPGETLAILARQYNVSLTAMREANTHLPNPHLLKAGQVVNIPAKGTAQTSDGSVRLARN